MRIIKIDEAILLMVKEKKIPNNSRLFKEEISIEHMNN